MMPATMNAAKEQQHATANPRQEAQPGLRDVGDLRRDALEERGQVVVRLRPDRMQFLADDR